MKMKYQMEEISIGVLKWISEWFSSNCNEDWEYENQIKTISNLGWYITIDLTNTILEGFEISVGTIEKDHDDWYFYCFKDSQFTASGDLNKIEFLLNEFKRIVILQKGGV